MIKDLNTRVNPLKYAQISVLCCNQIQDLDEAFDFLGQASDRVKQRADATYYLRIAQAEKRLDQGKHHDSLEILNEVRGEVESQQDLNPKVYAFMANVFSQYYTRKGD